MSIDHSILNKLEGQLSINKYHPYQLYFSMKTIQKKISELNEQVNKSVKKITN